MTDTEQPTPQAKTPNQLANERTSPIYRQWRDGAITYAQAYEQLQAIQQEATANEDYLLLGAVGNTLGIINGWRSKYNEAIKYLEEGRKAYEQAGADDQMALIDSNLGETYRLQGNFTRARMYFHRAYEAAKATNNRRMQASALGNEGQMWISLRSHQKAYQILQQALTLSSEPYDEDETEARRGDRMAHLCELYHVMVPMLLDEERKDEAWQYAKNAYTIAQELQRPIRLGYAYRALGDVVTAIGEAPDEGFSNDPDEYYKLSIKAFRKIKSEGEVGKTLYAQGMSLKKRDKGRSAARLFQQAMVIFTKLGMSDDAAKAAEAQLSVF